jgi:hypothetical protein
VAVHLAVLCLVLEREVDLDHARAQRGPLTSRPRPFGWLEPPASRGSVTVQDVLDAACGEERDARVRDWALDVWRAWAPHQDTIRDWLGEGAVT